MPCGVTIEAAFIPANAPQSQGCFVVWPCMGGDSRMYTMPVEQFAKNGWDVLLYNPRGHGNSTGYLSVETAADDLKTLLQHCNLSEVPLTAFGHSGGCAAWLKAADSGIAVKAFYFAAPVLDSRRSLFYMYEKGTIGEFVFVTSRLACDPEFFKQTLADTTWLEPEHWHDRNLETVLNGPNGAFPVGTFLKALFIPGIDSMPELAKRESDVTIFFPQQDNWYPHQTTMDASSGLLRTVVVDDAKDHYFSCGWERVWEDVGKRLRQ
ncbi:hypothetical protein DSLASN_18580 [Desulfoluna limicola]|uniref:Serine aminopeptidase S33 domain-containing protein n=2 Tax=Desulfoluna limicola TaxID=2810562 RepID=A0ABN6F3M0_9BACT|nr:hypothetical protein DSLASN_18580 [Desulfoluna limicola]